MPAAHITKPNSNALNRIVFPILSNYIDDEVAASVAAFRAYPERATWAQSAQGVR